MSLRCQTLFKTYFASQKWIHIKSFYAQLYIRLIRIISPALKCVRCPCLIVIDRAIISANPAYQAINDSYHVNLGARLL